MVNHFTWAANFTTDTFLKARPGLFFADGNG
jgi:hypothetical protein